MKNLEAIKQRYGIIGMSTSLEQALKTAIRVAPTELSVLISGESGVGKEAFSKIIHDQSPRKHESAIAINCGAIPEGTINSELFGHEKGAYTGATSERKGYFETVNGGTIFLDEIGEMPLDTQAFLLRILESGEFLRVGSSKVLKTDVRVIAATNVDLQDRVAQGKFRQDLYYRLSTVPIKVPALRERKEDIWMLFRKFSLDFAERQRIEPISLSSDARLLLEQYRWPGNIRELKNVAEQISILSERREISLETLQSFIPKATERNLPMLRSSSGSGMELNEREILYKLLFDMKSDLSDLKNLIYELIQTNDLEINAGQLKQLAEAGQYHKSDESSQYDYSPSHALPASREAEPDFSTSGSARPIILDTRQHGDFNQMEVVEESLSIEDMEKELIKKALEKHKGKRKDAADDLGISERTLYRKIKQYEIQQ
ncbi:MAG: sigma-54 dependent transcriptional regulator [Saprospiraceae bacterium]|nr:sigma-54 dependent transcriptional regulator [Saprospiraceae bacterium]